VTGFGVIAASQPGVPNVPNVVNNPDVRRSLVLVIEDNVDAQLITGSMLAHFGYEVIEAESLAEARRVAKNRKPDVVVLDCRLPDGDGLELAQEWRRDPQMKDVPIVCLTAFWARQDMEAALLAGVDGFLVKPCPGAVLVAQIERVLVGRRPSQTLRAQRPERP
jgi:DNA-binding response OmpR family regulator